MGTECCICHKMKILQDEQKMLTGGGACYQFVCSFKKYDTIPFMLISISNNDPFSVIYKDIKTPFFRLKRLYDDTCFAVLTLLEPIDMEGNRVTDDNGLYSLQKTDECVIVKLCCFCGIQPLEIELVNRPLPTIEPKW